MNKASKLIINKILIKCYIGQNRYVSQVILFLIADDTFNF